MSHADMKAIRLSANVAPPPLIDTDIDSGSETTAGLNVSNGSASGELLSRPSSPSESVGSFTLFGASQLPRTIPVPSTPPLTSCAKLLPSVGSALHLAGECRPCAWFWKAQGCQNGQECRHCHLCPEGTIKARKLAKLSGRSASGHVHSQFCLDCNTTTGTTDNDKLESCPSFEEFNASPVVDTTSDLSLAPDITKNAATLLAASVGSLLHGSGECKPCAWFWKPSGCQNGQECSRCHLCPDGEVKNRKKAKKAALRMTKQECMASDECADTDMPMKIDLLACSSLAKPADSGVTEVESRTLSKQLAISPPPGLCAAAPSYPLPSPVSPSASFNTRSLMWQSGGHQFVGQDTVQHQQPLYANLVLQQTMNGSSPSCVKSKHADTEEDLKAIPSGRPDAIARGLLSVGSAAHGTGTCSPCAWFWKPQGCQNGTDCRRCHLCTPTDAKILKKAKHSAMRQADL